MACSVISEKSMAILGGCLCHLSPQKVGLKAPFRMRREGIGTSIWGRGSHWEAAAATRRGRRLEGAFLHGKAAVEGRIGGERCFLCLGACEEREREERVRLISYTMGGHRSGFLHCGRATVQVPFTVEGHCSGLLYHGSPPFRFPSLWKATVQVSFTMGGYRSRL
ncbi:hypothetical protein Taro_044281 [Colocasia esculenta]|uniref:Uncharacterized protein n=1 Tax=Colocasia esculenta TaxID=4460 RepID=A0A843X326_COLES|nr:hypothetical protein [Colocasia esculenta]